MAGHPTLFLEVSQSRVTHLFSRETLYSRRGSWSTARPHDGVVRTTPELRLLIALPALNEEAEIGAVLDGLPRAVEGFDEISWLVIDDGSSDRTGHVAAERGARVLRHPTNRGVGQAFQSAVSVALRRRADVMVTMDSDGQFDAGEIPRLVRPCVEGSADFVTGTRFAGGRRPANMPIGKYWGNLVVRWILRHFTSADLSDVSCGFRAYSREALLQLNLFGKFTYTQETIMDLTFKGLRLAEVPVTVRYSSDRRSRVAGSLIRYGINALKIITRTARDYKPMRFFGALGAVVFSFGVVLDVWLLAYFLRTSSFSPYKFVGFAGVTLNIAGILVFGLALLADMLDRMRVNQERLLYQLRRLTYEDRSDGSSED